MGREIDLISKALKHRLTYLPRVYTPPETEILDNRYIYYRHSLIRVNKPWDQKYKDLVNIAKRLSRLLQHIFFGTPAHKILGRFRVVSYVMVIDIVDKVVCSSCTIGTTNINGVAFWTGICVGSSSCINIVIEKEKLRLVLLPEKMEISSCIEYTSLRRYIEALDEVVEHHLCITYHAKDIMHD